MKSTFDGEARGWTVRVELTPEQEQVAWRNIGAQRFAHNWAVDQIEKEYRGGDKRIWSMIGMRQRWYEQRDEVAPWWAENSKEAYSSGIESAVTALKNFQDGRKGKRAGERPGFPRRKRKVTAPAVFSVSTGFALKSAREIKIPLIGVVRSTERMRRMVRAQARGDLHVTGMVLRHKTGRWYVSIRHRISPRSMYRASDAADRSSVVGVDLGVGKMLSTASDGTVALRTNLKKAESRVRAAQRRTRRRTRGSTRWKAAMDDARKASARAANVRKDLIHKTTTYLAKTHGVVVLEDLSVKGMARGWSRSAGSSGMYEFRRQIEYKAQLALIADRFYPSSKTCSACQRVNANLTLSDDVWDCECGAHHQRDENAAQNLAQLGAAWIDGKTVPCAPHGEMKRKPRAKSAA